MCQSCARLVSSDCLEAILRAIAYLERSLSVPLEEFLHDEVRQHAVGFHLLVWARWAQAFPPSFALSHPRIDLRAIYLLVERPKWADVWTLRDEMPAMKAEVIRELDLLASVIGFRYPSSRKPWTG